MTSKTDSVRRSTPQGNPRTGLALALALLTLSGVFSLLPTYFISATVGVSITLFIVGLMGVGVDLNRLSSGQASILDDFSKGKGIFDNLFFGLGFVLSWLAIHYFYNNIWTNVAISLVLLFGAYAIYLGVVNWVVNYYVSKRDLEERRIRIETEGNKREELVKHNADRYLQAMLNSLNILAIILTIITSIIAIITFLDQMGIIKVIPK